MATQFGLDRARFLAFAAAFAGAASFQGCSASDKSETADGGAAGTAQAGHSPTAGDAGFGGENSVAGSAGSAGEAGNGGVAAAGGDSAGAAQGGASDGGATGAAGAAGAAECNDNLGFATCAGVSARCSHYCNAALSNLKPAVADLAIACLKLDTSSNCDAGYTCLAEATARGCQEDVKSACASASVECNAPAPNEPSCEQLLSGMTSAARAEAASCIDEGCYSVYSCAEGLFFE